MATLTADPPWTYHLGQASAALGVDPSAVSAAVARTSSWGRFVGLGHGSGGTALIRPARWWSWPPWSTAPPTGPPAGADLRAALVGAVERRRGDTGSGGHPGRFHAHLPALLGGGDRTGGALMGFTYGSNVPGFRPTVNRPQIEAYLARRGCRLIACGGSPPT